MIFAMFTPVQGGDLRESCKGCGEETIHYHNDARRSEDRP